MSSHGLGLADQLALARQLDVLPRSVWLIGAVLGRAEPGSAPGTWMDRSVESAHRRIAAMASGS
jgi:hypothetical protein